MEEIEKWLKDKFSKFKNVKLLVAGDKFRHKDLTIIGDCGFAANNPRFNYRNGIYRGAILTESDERYYTNRWRHFFEQEVSSGGKTLIITHHPPTDWGHNYETKHNNRYYIFGHVHDIDARTCAGVEIIKKANFYGDAANGYMKDKFEIKVLEVK